MSSEPSGDEVPTVYCPHCWQKTAHVQEYEVTTMLFLLVYAAWQTSVVAGCPSCVRRQLRQVMAFSLPMTNILFPFYALSLLGQIRDSRAREWCGIPDHYRAWADLTPPLVKERPPQGIPVGRFLIILLILALVVVGAFVVLPWLTKSRLDP